MRQIVTMDHHDRDFIISSYSRTRPGYWVANGTFVRVPDRASNVEIGSSVLRALDASRQGVPMPARFSPSPFEPVLQDIGLTSYDDYVAEVMSVDIARDDDDHVVVTPKRHDPSGHLMSEITERARTLEHPDEAALAEAVRGCLAEAE